MENFLQRYVKEDGKGLYVHLGVYRLRPFVPAKTTFKEGALVSMIQEQGRRINPLEMCVFENIKEYEIWGTKTRS